MDSVCGILQPQGAAVHNFVIQLALSMVCEFLTRFSISLFVWFVLKMTVHCVHFIGHYYQVASESIKIYQAISDGTINMVDKVGKNIF